MDSVQSDSSLPAKRPPAEAAQGWPGLMLDLYPYPAIIVDAAGQVIAANAPARHVSLPPRDSREQTFATDAGGARIEPSELPRFLARRAATAEGMEITWHMPERTAHFRVLCRNLPAEPGPAGAAMLTFLDITREKLAEEELRHALTKRDEFFSVATHELKDPLFSLRLAIQLLRRQAKKQGGLAPALEEQFEVCNRQTERLAQLIDNLLDISRLSNGRLRLDVEALDLSELAQEMVQRLQVRARARNVQMELEAREPVIGYFDRVKLEQVLANLLTNALKYGAGKPIIVRVGTQDDTAVLEVEDHGIGIAPEDQGRVFERFERAADSFKKESLGLGLYIVRSYVEAHGGSIRLTSEPGRGSTFTITLPRKRIPQDDPAGEGSVS